MEQIQDTPVDYMEETTTVEDSPIETVELSPVSAGMNKFLAVQSAFMDNYINGSSIIESYSKYSKALDPQAEAKSLASQKTKVDAEEVAEVVVSDPYGTTGDVNQELAIAQQVLGEIENKSSDVDLNFAESAIGEAGSLEDAQREANKIKMWKMLAGWQEEIGTTDAIVEVGKQFFIPFLESARGAKVTGEYFGAKEEFQGMIRAWKAMPTEEQVALLPTLKEELVERVGNVDAINMLGDFLDPMGDADFDRFGGEELVWDVLDATGVGYALGVALKGTAKSVNTIKTLKALKNDEAAEQAAAISVLDPDMADAMGVDEVTATANLLPYDTSKIIIGRTAGLSNKAQKNLDEFFDEVDSTTQEIIEGTTTAREGVVSDSYRKQLEQDVLKKFQAEQAENVRIKSKDGVSTTFEYQILDEDGNLTDQTYEMVLDLDHAGNFGQSTMGLIREYVGSPTAFARNTLRKDVDTAQRLDYVSAKINRQLTDLTKKAIEPIGLIPTPKTKASLARVDKALREGDEWKNTDGSRGKVFSADELRTKFGFETENEISAYYRINRLYNNLWHLRNSEKRDELRILGYRKARFARSDEDVIGKTYENALTARAALTDKSINMIYDAELDEVIDLRQADSDLIAGSYDNDKVLIRMDRPYDAGEGKGAYRYALVNRDSIGDLPNDVLGRKVGYVPRIYENAAHFVKERVTRVVDGDKEFADTKTLRFFDNKKDADAYIEKLIGDDIARSASRLAEEGLEGEAYEKALAKAEQTAHNKYIALTDREEEQLAAAAGEVAHGTGGLYTGARAQDEILFGLEGERASRVNSFEALTRNIGNVSKYTSINKWRLGMEQRWINTANEILKAKGREATIKKFERLPKTSESSPEVRFLNRVFDQIRDWQSFPTPEEQFFSNMVRGLSDFAAEKNFRKTARFLGNFKDADPISAARATAFHTLLGFFNPAHMWIQAQGAATAISLGFGKYLTQTLRDTAALTGLGYGAKDAARYARTAKATLMDKNELEALHNLWLKTGYEDSVLQTADHAAASKGYGMNMAILKKVADTGLLFYRQGELFNRRMAFSTAVARWKEKKGVDSIIGAGDDSLKEIMDDANNIMLNMSKANAAPWQKGLASLPTQFLQVTTKSVETMTGLNKNFTKAEAGRIFAGQLALYGTAGIPLVSLPYMLATEVFGMTQQDIEQNPKLFKALNDGFWGYTTLQIFGMDAEISSRGSLLRGVGDFIDNWFVQESTFTEKFLGAFGSSQQRFWDDFTRRLRPITLDSMSELDFSDVGSLLASPVFSMFSTYNNVQKAIIMERLDAAYSRSGKKIASGFNFSEAVAQAIGFQPTKVADTWDLTTRIKWLNKLPETIAGDILVELNSFAAKYPNGDYDDEAWEKHNGKISILYGLLDYDERERVKKLVNRSFTGKSQHEMAVQKYVENMRNTTADDLNVILGSKAIRLGIIAEED